MPNNNKVKLLLCSPNNDTVGGITRWTGHILRYYNTIKDNSNIELEQFYPNGKGVYQHTFFISRLYIGVKKYLPFLTEIKKRIDNGNFDVVHFVSSASISLIRDLLAISIAKKRGLKSVIHFRFGRIPEIYQKRNWEQKLLHKVINLADKVIVIDMLSFNTLQKEGYKNIVLLPNPLTPEVIEIINKNPTIKRVHNKILFAGHNVVAKGIFELIDACNSIPNITLKMIGYITPDIRKQLIDHAGSGHERWLEIAGEQNFETTIKEMLSAGVFALPTYSEGFPNVIIESMACGCPIITTNVGAIPEMLAIDKGFDHGMVIEPRNVEQLRDAICKMLNDREYATQCGLNAQQRVNEQYAMPKVWEKMVEIWNSK